MYTVDIKHGLSRRDCQAVCGCPPNEWRETCWHMCTCVYVCMYVCMQTRAHVCKCVCLCMFVCDGRNILTKMLELSLYDAHSVTRRNHPMHHTWNHVKECITPCSCERLFSSGFWTVYTVSMHVCLLVFYVSFIVQSRVKKRVSSNTAWIDHPYPNMIYSHTHTHTHARTYMHIGWGRQWHRRWYRKGYTRGWWNDSR